jgi:hypothetical protein
VSEHIYNLAVGLTSKLAVSIPMTIYQARKEKKIKQALEERQNQLKQEREELQKQRETVYGDHPTLDAKIAANQKLQEKLFKSELRKQCKVLGVDENASEEEIKEAFKQKVLEVHPDKNPDDPQAAQKFQAVKAAKEFFDQKKAFKRKVLGMHPDKNPDDPQAAQKFTTAKTEKDFVDKKEMDVLSNTCQPHAILNGPEEESLAQGSYSEQFSDGSVRVTVLNNENGIDYTEQMSVLGAARSDMLKGTAKSRSVSKKIGTSKINVFPESIVERQIYEKRVDRTVNQPKNVKQVKKAIKKPNQEPVVSIQKTEYTNICAIHAVAGELNIRTSELPLSKIILHSKGRDMDGIKDLLRISNYQGKFMDTMISTIDSSINKIVHDYITKNGTTTAIGGLGRETGMGHAFKIRISGGNVVVDDRTTGQKEVPLDSFLNEHGAVNLHILVLNHTDNASDRAMSVCDESDSAMSICSDQSFGAGRGKQATPPPEKKVIELKDCNFRITSKELDEACKNVIKQKYLTPKDQNNMEKDSKEGWRCDSKYLRSEGGYQLETQKNGTYQGKQTTAAVTKYTKYQANTYTYLIRKIQKLAIEKHSEVSNDTVQKCVCIDLRAVTNDDMNRFRALMSKNALSLEDLSGQNGTTKDGSTKLGGLNSFEQSSMMDISLPVYEYTMSGITKILALRSRIQALARTGNVGILPNYYSFRKEDNNIFQIFFELRQRTEKHVLVPLSLYDKHAVGIMFVAQEDGSGYKAFYLDPENNTIPEDLSTIFKDNGYQIEQLPTEGQRYTNCGPEVIENFMLYLTGERLSQEEAIVNNSRLVEQELLSSSHDAEEANSLSIKDSYRKQDTVTVISNTGYNTQVSSDGYAIDNPTKYDIVTPQTIIDGVLVRAEVGIEPRDILIELLNDYRMNQSYAESILGEVGSIDIS